MTSSSNASWKTPFALLMLMAIASPLAFSVWSALLNNFAVERAAFDGAQIGLLQTIREIPGFLAFAAIFLLLFLREQSLACLSLGLLGIGVALTGWFPSELGLYLTTFVMSMGFHYFETVKQSLSLQWLDRSKTAELLGRLVAVSAATSLAVYAGLWLLVEVLGADYRTVYLVGGGLCLLLVLLMILAFPQFKGHTAQRKQLILRRRYWLYYALTFMSGARRQIFMVFAGFLLVERFGYTVGQIATLFLLNHALSWLFAARVGRWIGRVGERVALTVEYIGLIGVFLTYSMVENGGLAATLYVIDHLFFAMAIAINTYFQKIADPSDFAGSAGVSFTINHIAAVMIPVLFGLIWLHSPALVFQLGAAMAATSLVLARLIPVRPQPGHETRFQPALI